MSDYHEAKSRRVSGAPTRSERIDNRRGFRRSGYRPISVRASFYDTLKPAAAARGISMSALVERALAGPAWEPEATRDAMDTTHPGGTSESKMRALVLSVELNAAIDARTSEASPRQRRRVLDRAINAALDAAGAPR